MAVKLTTPAGYRRPTGGLVVQSTVFLVMVTPAGAVMVMAGAALAFEVAQVLVVVDDPRVDVGVVRGAALVGRVVGALVLPWRRAHTLPMQRPEAQSEATRQWSPREQGGHTRPPQSTSVSLPPLRWLEQLC